jgi:hypothetical protein
LRQRSTGAAEWRAYDHGVYRVSVSIALSALAVLASACMSAGPGACGQDERDFFHRVDHFGDVGIEPMDHPLGICGATYTTNEAAEAVIDHYLDEFRDAGWDPGPPQSTPGSGEPGVERVTTVSGYEGTYQYHVDITEMADRSVQVIITAGNAGA